MSNSFVLMLLRLNPNFEFQLRKLFDDEKVDQILISKLSANWKFFNENFRTTEPSILMNTILVQLNKTQLPRISMNTLNNYYNFEKEVETTVFNEFFNQFEVKKNEYKKVIEKQLATQKSESSMMSVIDELNLTPLEEFPLLRHLRLSPKWISFEDFSQKFQEKSSQFKNAHLITKFILENQFQLKKLSLISKFKKFYDVLIEKEDGKLARRSAEVYSVREFIETRIYLRENCEKFINSWNELISISDQDNFECQIVKFEQIDKDKSMTALIPNVYRDSRGANILLGLGYIIKTQNRFLETIGIQNDKISFACEWKHVSKESIFQFDEAKIEKQLNKECVLSHCNYGQLGSTEIDFDQFEKLMQEQASQLKYFITGEKFVHQFQYAYESNQLTYLLRGLLERNNQLVFDKQTAEKYSEVLCKQNKFNNENVFGSLYVFITSHLLPRAILAKQEDFELTVFEFIKMAGNKKMIEEGLFNRGLESVRMNQLYSFTLLVELLLFESQFVENKHPITRLETDCENPNWKSTKKANLKKIVEHQFAQKHKMEFINAISRVVLRTTYNDDEVEHELEVYLDNETLWDLDCIFESPFDPKSESPILLKHAFLLFSKLSAINRKNTPQLASFQDRGLGVPMDQSDICQDNQSILLGSKRHRD